MSPCWSPMWSPMPPGPQPMMSVTREMKVGLSLSFYLQTFESKIYNQSIFFLSFESFFFFFFICIVFFFMTY